MAQKGIGTDDMVGMAASAGTFFLGVSGGADILIGPHTAGLAMGVGAVGGGIFAARMIAGR